MNRTTIIKIKCLNYIDLRYFSVKYNKVIECFMFW